VNINKLYRELLDHYFDCEITFYKIENNIIFVEEYDSVLDLYALFEFDLNKNLYTEIFFNGEKIYQENLMLFIINRQKYWDNMFYKVKSKLTKI